MGVWIEIHNTQTWETYQYSHSLRGSVDWNLKIWMVPESKTRHSLRGSVDWNSSFFKQKRTITVTPFVGVWIEIIFLRCLLLVIYSHSLRGSVDWNYRVPDRITEDRVTPFVGVWIEINKSADWQIGKQSLPSWECGLKLNHTKLPYSTTCHSLRGSVDWNSSPPLQHNKGTRHSLRGSVDWNTPSNNIKVVIPRHSLRGSVDWNPTTRTVLYGAVVTPFVGVWIEISFWYKDFDGMASLPSWECGLKFFHPEELVSIKWSLPSWECGLKFCTFLSMLFSTLVTPFVGVWIEIWKETMKMIQHLVTPFVGVWIEIALSRGHLLVISCHSLRGSVDWNILCDSVLLHSYRHSLRGSVDWNTPYPCPKMYWTCHSLRGSVDWNRMQSREYGFTQNVTPFVGVWIEIKIDLTASGAGGVTPFVGVWIEIAKLTKQQQDTQSLPSWECGLKCAKTTAETTDDRHSLRGSVDWNVLRSPLFLTCLCHSLRGSVD